MLRPETQRLWDFRKGQPALAGFILIGGTALEMQLHHRLSEDLDLITTAVKLPRVRLEGLLSLASQQGFHWVRQDDPTAMEDLLLSGMELHDYQQDFLVNETVKVTLFTADQAAARLLDRREESTVRVASLTEIFKLKSIVCADRSKTRDWFDLYLLMTEHGFTFEDFQAAFVQGQIQTKLDLALNRLCHGVPQLNDEGFAALLPDPPSASTMQSFFRAARDRYEIGAAERAARGVADSG